MRGFFGTGKSAAFGIANILRVSSIRNGKRSVVELRKSDFEASKSATKIPVRMLQKEVATRQQNGTTVEIEEVNLRHIDQASIIEYIERHLARWTKDATVFVNTHECEYREPPVKEVFTFAPSSQLRPNLGDIQLVVKVAKTPLPEADQGIAVLSHGVWYESTLAGSERKDQANLIFGEVEIPTLADQGEAKIPAFDLSRRMRLNKSNPLVQQIHAFIGASVEEVRARLVEEDRERKRSAETKALRQEASKIADIINQDFAAYKDRLQVQNAKLRGSVDNRAAVLRHSSGQDEALVEGGDIEAAIDQLSRGDPGSEGEAWVNGGGSRGALTDRGKGVVRDKATPDTKGSVQLGKQARAPRTGGFQVDFNHAGVEALRALYEPAMRTIWINLDHPQLSAALNAGGLEDARFRRLAYEVAFTEYSIGLVHELNIAKYYLDVQEAIFDVRDTLNRVSRAAAALYSA